MMMIHYGACYYPEHWTGEQAKSHIPLMQKAGFNVVRMGEFAWSKFEPEPGRYRFEWLDPVIKALHEAGIATVLGTPTCVPPPWVIYKYPHILQVDREGRTRHPGSRCHACKNAPEFRFLSEQITQTLARHYAEVEGVIGWQTDNEFGCHNTTRCYCGQCEKAFRDWLVKKYGDVSAVNEAWGTAFWSSEYRQWHEISVPRKMPTGCNPGHWLDFARFSSDTAVQFHKTQYGLLKSICPKHFVTHNFMGRFPEVDYYALSEYVDFAAWDNYPDAAGDAMETAYAHEITRSFKGRYWVMEEKSGPTGDADSGLLGEQPEPGEIRRWAWQSVANGADGICYFRWRACLTGAEQYWHGILDHDGVPRRRYAEVRKTGEELRAVATALDGTVIKAPVAVLRSFDILWSLERQPGAPGFSYDQHCFDLYRAVRRSGHNCDIVQAAADFSRYKVVLAPSLTLVDEDLATRLDAFVQGGGTLVLTPQSGTRTPTNAMTDKTLPGLLAELVGIAVEEVRPYFHGQTHQIQFRQGSLDGQTCAVSVWIELLRCTTAQPLAEYVDGAAQSRPAITCNSRGKGSVYYLGVFLARDVLERFIAGLLPEFAVKDIPDGVEVSQRRGPQGRLVFLINHTRERKSLTLPGQYPELLSGETVGPKIAISANGVLVLKA